MTACEPSAAERRRDDAAADALPPEVELINRHVRAGWADQGLAPSAVATDGEWCRRVYLDLVGRVPTVEELTEFLDDRSATRRVRLVDRLLGPEYLEQHAEHMTTVWTNLLIGRTGGVGRRSLADRDGMRRYLRGAFTTNKPVDRLMQELVTATGSCRPGDDDFNGAANFLADKMAEGGVQATAVTAKTFLGMQVQCTQCHNHPFNEYKQNQFWELNAFFRQTRVQRLPADVQNRRVARVLDRDFAGEGGDPTKAELYYELRNGKLKVAYPVFVTGESLAERYAARGEDYGDSGYVSEVNRRRELAELIRRSEQFPRAVVNRVWGRLLAYGFTKPVDDMGPHNPPSHPELLDGLATRFGECGFDLRRLTRWVVLSAPYSLSSRSTRRNAADDPAMGARPMFSRFYLRQMTAEQLYESLIAATGADRGAGYGRREALRRRWVAQFNRAFGNDENGEATTFDGSIPQALMMMNGDLIRRATAARGGSLLQGVAEDDALTAAEKVRRLYLAAVARPPGRDELRLCKKLVAASGGDVTAALEDIWWALLNSNEFIFNR